MKGRQKGSLTVEAVFVMAAILFVLTWIMKGAITMYQETAELAAVEWVDMSSTSERFRMMWLMQKMLD